MQLFSSQYLSQSPTEPYDVGTQKNRLIETILLSTNIIGLEGRIRKNMSNAHYIELWTVCLHMFDPSIDCP